MAGCVFQHDAPVPLLASQIHAARAGQDACTPLRSVERVEDDQPRIIHLRIGIAEGVPQLRRQQRAERIVVQIHAARRREGGAAPAQMVVQPKAEAQHPAWPQMRLPRKHEAQRPHQERRLPAHHLALAQRLAHQAELALLQVAQAAMDQLAAGAGGVRCQVVLFAQQYLQATATGITGDAGTVDATADHQQVDLVHRASASCLCRAAPPLTVGAIERNASQCARSPPLDSG
ncbi:hypothetical protein D3C72_1434980 [compost metagenome]